MMKTLKAASASGREDDMLYSAVLHRGAALRVAQIQASLHSNHCQATTPKPSVPMRMRMQPVQRSSIVALLLFTINFARATIEDEPLPHECADIQLQMGRDPTFVAVKGSCARWRASIAANAERKDYLGLQLMTSDRSCVARLDVYRHLADQAETPVWVGSAACSMQLLVPLQEGTEYIIVGRKASAAVDLWLKFGMVPSSWPGTSVPSAWRSASARALAVAADVPPVQAAAMPPPALPLARSPFPHRPRHTQNPLPPAARVVDTAEDLRDAVAAESMAASTSAEAPLVLYVPSDATISLNAEPVVIRGVHVHVQATSVAAAVIDGGGIGRLFDVQNGSLLLSRIHLFRGVANASDDVNEVADATNPTFGGAVSAVVSSIELERCLVSHCTGYGAGAIWIHGQSKLVIRESTFTDCTQQGGDRLDVGGGAIASADDTTLLLTKCSFYACVAYGAGGAISRSGIPTSLANVFINSNKTAAAQLRVYGCVFHGCSAWRGGAICNYWGGLELHDCSCASCTASSTGSAIFATATRVSVARSLFRGCHAKGYGAVYLALSPLTLRETVIDSCSADGGNPSLLVLGGRTLRVSSCILSNSTVPEDAPKQFEARAGEFFVSAGAINVWDCDSFFDSCVLHDIDNKVSTGGAMLIQQAVALVANCLLTRCGAVMGGAVCASQFSLCSMQNCTISQTFSYTRGGGVAALDGSILTLADCASNDIVGGSFYVENSQAFVFRCTVASCSALGVNGGSGGGGGAGLFVRAGVAELEDVAFIACTAAGSVGGGGVYASESRVSMRGCSVDRCEATLQGGGVFVERGSEINVAATRITGCTSQLHGAGVYVWSSALTMSEGSAIESCVVTSIDGSGPALFLRSGRAQLYDSAMRNCVSPAGEAGAIHVSSKSALYAYTLLLANCSAPQGASFIAVEPDARLDGALLSLEPPCGEPRPMVVAVDTSNASLRGLLVLPPSDCATPPLYAILDPALLPPCSAPACGPNAVCALAPVLQGEALMGSQEDFSTSLAPPSPALPPATFVSPRCECRAPAWPDETAASAEIAPYVEGCTVPIEATRVGVAAITVQSVVIQVRKPPNRAAAAALSENRSLEVAWRGEGPALFSWRVSGLTPWLRIPWKLPEETVAPFDVPLLTLSAATSGLRESSEPYSASVLLDLSTRHSTNYTTNGSFEVPVLVFVEAEPSAQDTTWQVVGDEGVCNSSISFSEVQLVIDGEQTALFFTACDIDSLPLSRSIPEVFQATLYNESGYLFRPAIQYEERGVHKIQIPLRLPAGRYSAELRLRDVPIAAGRRMVRLVCPEDTDRALDGTCACVAGKQPVFDAQIDPPHQRRRCEPCPEGEFKDNIGDFKCSPIATESPIWPIILIVIGSAAAVTLISLYIAWMRMRQIRRKQEVQLELNFAAVTYHEIRNPLNGTIGWLRFLASNSKVDNDLEMKECVNDALVCTEQAFHYLNSLSSMLKLEAGKMVALPTAVDITSVFEAATAIIRPQLNPGVKLKVNTPKNLGEVLMDATVLTHIIVNLTQNAVRFTQVIRRIARFATVFTVTQNAASLWHLSPFTSALGSMLFSELNNREKYEGAIEVGCDVSADLTAVFSVSDTGCGMTTETLASVFERYKSMSRGGVGIGLHISYKLVKVLGSEMQVESPWGNGQRGTRFFFTLQLQPAFSKRSSRMSVDGMGGFCIQTNSFFPVDGARSSRRETSLAEPKPVVTCTDGTKSNREQLENAYQPPLTEADAQADTPMPAQVDVHTVNPPHAKTEVHQAASALQASFAPAVAHQALPAAQAAPAVPALPKGLRVLVADDMRMNRKLLHRVLQHEMKAEWVVETVETAEEAMERVFSAEPRFGLVIFDENFGADRINGSQAIRRIRQAGFMNLVIISCTGGLGGTSSEEEILACGADAVWGKPFPSWVDGTMQGELSALLHDRLDLM